MEVLDKPPTTFKLMRSKIKPQLLALKVVRGLSDESAQGAEQSEESEEVVIEKPPEEVVIEEPPDEEEPIKISTL